MHSLQPFLRNSILQILNEQGQTETGAAGEKTTGPGRGGYKKSVREAGALAVKNPQELMKRLNISRVQESEDIKRLFSILEQASSGAGAMKDVYGDPTARKRSASGKQGVRLPVKVITPRDGMKYIEHTLLGAQNAGVVKFDQEIQVEILGNDVLAYFSPKPKSWGSKPKAKKSKPAPSEK